MLIIPSALQAKLDGGVTTLARCWLITRNDGAIQGFTDHDEDIVVNDVTCRAGSGLTASEATAQLGLSYDNTVAAVLNAAALRANVATAHELGLRHKRRGGGCT